MSVGGFLRRQGRRAVHAAGAPVRVAGRNIRRAGTATGIIEGERQRRQRRELESSVTDASERAQARDADAARFVPGPFSAPQIGSRGRVGFPGAASQPAGLRRGQAPVPGTAPPVGAFQRGQAPVPGVGTVMQRGQSAIPLGAFRRGQAFAPVASAIPGGATATPSSQALQASQALQSAPAPLGGAGMDARAQQGQLNAALLQRALGQGGPSVAGIQAEQARQANMANQMALAAANRGSTVGGAARLAALGSANAQQQAAGQGALLRAQEQQAAQGLAGQLLQGQRGQDIQAALGQARLDTQTDIANLQAQLQTMGLNQRQAAMLIQASLAERGLSAQQQATLLGADASRQAANRQILGGAINTGGNLLATLLADGDG